MSLDDLKNRIRSRVPLEALFTEHGVTLKSQSGHWVGKCCFHADSTPSLHIYDDNHYYCFGCKAHGDAITFVRETQGLGFIESMRYLAGRYGIDAPELDRPKSAQREAPLYRILQVSQDFFTSNLWLPHGENARSYLIGRGFDEASLKEYGFGVTPPEGFGLVRHLRNKGFRETDMIAASVATAATDSKRSYDFFRSRLTIPIHDAQGRLIAFGGRTLDGHSAKYVNSRETPVFQKSQTLFGLDKARPAMRQRGRAIVVEGYMDALMLRRYGFGETVGILGTALNVDHLKLIERVTNLCYLLLDSDEAGQTTTLETVNIALAVPRLEIRAITLPNKGQDPDEFVRAHGADGLEDLIRQSRDLFEFALTERFRNTPNLAIPELVQREFVPWLAQVADPLKCDILAGRISQLTGVSMDRILPSVREARRHLKQRSQIHSAGASALATHASQASQEKLPPPASTPLKPLGIIDHEIFGLIFHAQPTEIDCDKAEGLILRELELELPYQDLMAEMLAALRRGSAPTSCGLGDFASSSVPDIATLIERLMREGKRFQANARNQQLLRLFEENRKQRLKQEIGRLNSQLARLQLLRNPEFDQEIHKLLSAIAERRRRLDRNERPEADASLA